MAYNQYIKWQDHSSKLSTREGANPVRNQLDEYSQNKGERRVRLIERGYMAVAGHSQLDHRNTACLLSGQVRKTFARAEVFSV